MQYNTDQLVQMRKEHLSFTETEGELMLNLNGFLCLLIKDNFSFVVGHGHIKSWFGHRHRYK